jgi:hypothetical protein
VIILYSLFATISQPVDHNLEPILAYYSTICPVIPFFGFLTGFLLELNLDPSYQKARNFEVFVLVVPSVVMTKLNPASSNHKNALPAFSANQTLTLSFEF